VGAFELRIWTYWEGPLSAFQAICLGSISRFFGSSHVHLTPETLTDYIEVPDWVLTQDRAMNRADYFRAALLAKYGGWWFDADFLLWKDPFHLVGNSTKTWRSKYVGSRRMPLISTIWVPLPGDSWVLRTLELLSERRDRKHPPHHPMIAYADAYDEVGDVELGGWREFYSVPMSHWESLWDGSVKLDAAAVGVHSWWNAIRDDGRYSTLSSVEAVKKAAPDSLFAHHSQWARQDILEKSCG